MPDSRKLNEITQDRIAAGLAQASRPLEPGDVVTLLSGGPMMTVAETKDAVDEVFCIWFDDAKHLHNKWIPTELLVKR